MARRKTNAREGPLLRMSVSSRRPMRADPRFSGINGQGVSVVVIDTGINLSSPFFGNRIVYQYDFSGGNDGNASDTNGHGSTVASIIGSQDGTYTGMAPGVNIIALKVFAAGA